MIEGVLDHRWLVVLGRGKSFACPVLIEDGCRMRCRLAIDERKLGENRLGKQWLLAALRCRDTDKAGQSIGAPVVVGRVVNLAQWTAFAESLA